MRKAASTANPEEIPRLSDSGRAGVLGQMRKRDIHTTDCLPYRIRHDDCQKDHKHLTTNIYIFLHRLGSSDITVARYCLISRDLTGGRSLYQEYFGSNPKCTDGLLAWMIASTASSSALSGLRRGRVHKHLSESSVNRTFSARLSKTPLVL